MSVFVNNFLVGPLLGTYTEGLNLLSQIGIDGLTDLSTDPDRHAAISYAEEAATELRMQQKLTGWHPN